MFRDSKVPQELLGFKVIQVVMVYQVPKGVQVVLGFKAHLVPVVFKVLMVYLVRLVVQVS